MEDDYLPISGLHHLLFCERRCALVHVEQIWVDNQFTSQGQVFHEHVHAGGEDLRKGIRRVYSCPLASMKMRITGIADIVEWDETNSRPQPLPVEFKVGSSKHADFDRVQLCAQALCLEEMHGVSVPRGAIFYGKTRKREVVEFDAALRAKTEAAVRRFHEIVEGGVTPPAVYSKVCESCSLNPLCLPKKTQSPKEGSRYLASCLKGDE